MTLHFFYLKSPISCCSKGRTHAYLGCVILVNDKNLHCHMNSIQSCLIRSWCICLQNIQLTSFSRSEIGILSISQDTQLNPSLNRDPWLNILFLSLNYVCQAQNKINKQRYVGNFIFIPIVGYLSLKTYFLLQSSSIIL